ncbi:hypothetical protein PFISCL1PPCAC_12861 [Pristionchus fissidentatus]|uniref:Uncharacterized protein n=1 Tax=Pristionchus fissidentatus TaxID=1538716 RepID=A0AAV5VUX8_9BILA|nr:hypothetical protein PFISCL1PPCAC_12861 [Pristionchus fissidentatus]
MVDRLCTRHHFPSCSRQENKGMRRASTKYESLSTSQHWKVATFRTGHQPQYVQEQIRPNRIYLNL